MRNFRFNFIRRFPLSSGTVPLATIQMRFARWLRAPCSPAIASQYWQHLFPAIGQELVPCADLLPTAAYPIEDAYSYQQRVIEMAEERKRRVAAWTIIAANSSALRNYTRPQTVIGPVLDSHMTMLRDERPLSFQPHSIVQRLLAVELALAVWPGASRATLVVAPALVLWGSRFPLCAPHLPGYVADSGGVLRVAVLNRTTEASPQDLVRHGCVLTAGGEPVATATCATPFGSLGTATETFSNLVAKCHPSLPQHCQSLRRIEGASGSGGTDRLPSTDVVGLVDTTQQGGDEGASALGIPLIVALDGRHIGKPGSYEGNFGHLGTIRVNVAASPLHQPAGKRSLD